MAALFFAVLGVVYFGLKQWGFIGRQFGDGLNTQKTIGFMKLGDEAIIQVAPSRRGITRYSIRREDEGDKNRPNFAYVLVSRESLCGQERTINKPSHMRSQENIVFLDDPRASRKLIRPSLWQRRKPVCIYVKLDTYAGVQPLPLKFVIRVHNTRPCWGIECLLD